MLPAPRPDYQASGPAEEAGAANPAIRPQKLLAGLMRLWWIPLLTLLLGGGIGTALVMKMPPTYVASARMWETEKMRLPEGGVEVTEDMQNFLGTMTELMQSANLRNLALDRLAHSSNALEMRIAGTKLPVKITVAPAAKSSILVLNGTSSEPRYVQAYMDALMDVYLQFKRDARKIQSGVMLESITEVVAKWEGEVKTAEDALTSFEKTNNMAILESAGTVSGSHLAKLQTDLSDLQMEARLLNATREEDLKAQSNGNWTAAGGPPPATGGGAFNLPGAMTDVTMLKMESNSLSEKFKPKHPRMLKLSNDISREETLIGMYQKQSQEQLDRSRRDNELKITETKAVMEEAKSNVVATTGLLAEADRLKSNLQRVQSIYDRLDNLVQNVGISRDIDQDNLAILEQATSAKRTFTKEIGVAALSLVGGVVLGLGLIFILILRDDRFTSAREVTQRFGDSIVGQVPEIIGVGKNAHVPLLAVDDQRHLYSEAYRSLRSALLFVAAESERPRVILITSAVPDEGKSTVTANLARVMALGGARVVLVDADMRQGCLDQLVGVERAPGLSELLRQVEPMEKVIRTDTIPNLHFIPRGRSVGNPGDLLLSPVFEQLLAQLRGRFDYVLIDSSPVFAADDATTIAPKVDGTLFVVRNRFSSSRVVEEAIQLLSQRRARILGVIFNRADATSRSYYYYKYDKYHPEASTA